MALAIHVAFKNVERGTGGPFGSAIFQAETGRLVSVGMNLVVRNHNSTLHGEMVAFQMAQSALGTHTLGGEGQDVHELFTSCEPCAMCLGATLWSGVRRLVCAASGEDARALGFDEGPVFEESYAYLRDRGVLVEREVMRAEGQAVLARYRDLGGLIYNG
jgi:tRNA(Arg) A34 adenosine deaminase TadA